MSIELNGTDGYAVLAGAPVDSLPLTMACWAYNDLSSVSPTEVIISITDYSNSNGTGYFVWCNGDEWSASAGSDGVFGGSDIIGLVAGEWQHLAGVFRTTTDRQVYRNGLPGGVDTTLIDITPGDLDGTYVGAAGGSSSVTAYWDGGIAEIGIWDTDLSEGELKSLAAGVSPLRVRRENLVMYFPLFEPENVNNFADSQYHMTGFGTPIQASTNPPVAPQFGFDSGAAYALGVDVTGSACWGHDTGVEEDNTRVFSGNWTGDALITGSGDSEKIVFESGQYLEMKNAWNLATVGESVIDIDKYQAGLGSLTLKFKNGSSQASCEAATWATAVGGLFTCDGWFMARIES